MRLVVPLFVLSTGCPVLAVASVIPAVLLVFVLFGTIPGVWAVLLSIFTFSSVASSFFLL